MKIKCKLFFLLALSIASITPLNGTVGCNQSQYDYCKKNDNNMNPVRQDWCAKCIKEGVTDHDYD
jgi:hypothetical protein